MTDAALVRMAGAAMNVRIARGFMSSALVSLDTLPFADDVGEQFPRERVVDLHPGRVEVLAEPLQQQGVAVTGEGRPQSAEEESVRFQGAAHVRRAGLDQGQF